MNSYSLRRVLLSAAPLTVMGIVVLMAVTGDNGLLRAQCMVGPKAALLWIYDKGPPREKRAFAPVRGAKVAFSGLAPGAYRVVFWDTYAGKAVQERTVTIPPGPVRLPLPEFTKDIACKVLRAPSPPGTSSQARSSATGRRELAPRR